MTSSHRNSDESLVIGAPERAWMKEGPSDVNISRLSKLLQQKSNNGNAEDRRSSWAFFKLEDIEDLNSLINNPTLKLQALALLIFSFRRADTAPRNSVSGIWFKRRLLSQGAIVNITNDHPIRELSYTHREICTTDSNRSEEAKKILEAEINKDRETFFFTREQLKPMLRSLFEGNRIQEEFIDAVRRILAA